MNRIEQLKKELKERTSRTHKFKQSAGSGWMKPKTVNDIISGSALQGGKMILFGKSKFYIFDFTKLAQGEASRLQYIEQVVCHLKEVGRVEPVLCQ